MKSSRKLDWFFRINLGLALLEMFLFVKDAGPSWTIFHAMYLISTVCFAGFIEHTEKKGFFLPSLVAIFTVTQAGMAWMSVPPLLSTGVSLTLAGLAFGALSLIPVFLALVGAALLQSIIRYPN